MELKSSDMQPLYMQLKSILQGEIESGRYQKGEKIPTELELSRRYHVSRITVRNALNELAKENLLVRKQGKGTFVTADKISEPISGIRGFSEMCRANGYEPGAKVIKSVIEDANEQDIAELRLSPGSKVIVLERIRSADGVPVSYEISRFPERFSFLLHEDLNNCSMFDLLKEKYAVTFEKATKVIELTFATYEMAHYLEVPSGYPLLSIRSTARDQDGQPGHRAMQFIVGDNFKLIV